MKWLRKFPAKIRQNAIRLWTTRHFPYEGLVVIALAAFATQSCERTRFMHALEMANLDAWVASEDPKLSRNVVLVYIDDKDYDQPFEKISPLKVEEVKKLVTAVVKAGAALVVVDLDTSAWKEADLPSRWLPGQPSSKVIWARTTTGEGSGAVLNSVAGWNAGVRPGPSEVCWGVPQVVLGGDIVRAYRPQILIGKNAVPSLSAAAAVVFATQTHRQEKNYAFASRDMPNCEALSLQFSNEPESAILNSGSAKFDRYHARDARTFATWTTPTPLTGKIAVVGGTYAEARDLYHTAAGDRFGIEIVATAIESELDHPISVEASDWRFYTWDIALGLSILLLGSLLPRFAGLWVVIVGIPVAAFLGSFYVFHSAPAHFISFMPVLLGVFFHKVFDQWREGEDARRKHEEYRLEIVILKEKIINLNVELTSWSDRRVTLSEVEMTDLLKRITMGPA